MISLLYSEMSLSPYLAGEVGRKTERTTRFKLIFVAVILTLGTPVSQAQMLSQCVKDGTVIHLQCPVDDFDEDEDYITWTLGFEYETDYDYDFGTGGLNANVTINWSGNVAGYDVEEITCQLEQSHFKHAVIIVTDPQNPVLPITPYLQKGSGHTLNLIWDNPETDFESKDDVYYNYTVRVSVTDGYQLTEHLAVEAHNQSVIKSVNLTSLECKHVDVEVSLPGNCEDKRISGVLLKTPMQFQGNVDCQTLYNDNGIAEQVQINFMFPDLCPFQSASYTLSFDDGSEVWSTHTYLKTTTTLLVLNTINVETELRREENYTLNVTIITDYANVSSITTCSTHALLGLGPTDLRVIGYNYTTVELAWSNPNVLTFSFTYLIMFHLFDSGGSINTLKESFRREENPFISIDLNGFECEKIQITVAVFGDEEKAQSINATLPSYTTTFTKELHVETSLYNNIIIREAELSFIPPRRCEFQISSYQTFITDGNKTWSNTEDPVPITDTQRLIEVEIESGFTFNTYYTATVLVFTEYANISSTKHFRFVSDPQVVTDTLGTSTDEESSGALVGGVVGGVVFLLVVVLLCGFGAGMVAVYLLRQRKEKRQRQTQHAVGRCMVTNPIYGGSDGFYEELPETPTSTGPNITHIATSNSSSEVPSVPPPRKAGPEGMTLPELSQGEKEAMEAKLNEPLPLSSSPSQQYDETAEDCYTVMSPAGTVMMLSRNRHSVASIGGSAPWPMGGTL